MTIRFSGHRLLNVAVGDPADGPVPVKKVEGQGFVGRDATRTRDRLTVRRDVLDVHRVGEDNGGVLADWVVDGVARVAVGGQLVAGNAAADERAVGVGAKLVAVAGYLKKKAPLETMSSESRGSGGCGASFRPAASTPNNLSQFKELHSISLF